jgi:hypothetical protein
MRNQASFLASLSVAGAVLALAAGQAAVAAPAAGTGRLVVDTPMPAPAWALAERQLLAANAEGVKAFEAAFVMADGHLRGPEHYGIADGPDDAVEPIRNWPLAHALGGPDSIIQAWSHVWEGHLDQYSRAKVPQIAAAKDGIYYREFQPQYDWEHLSEGLAGFYFYGLSRPDDPRYAERLRRFAGFYIGEDASAPNYDKAHHLIRSLINGSKGPRLTDMSVDDWDGPFIEGEDPARRTRFLKSGNVRGDHPLNLNAANLAFQAFLVTGDRKYRDWTLEYVEAWRGRTLANGGNIPSNIGLDGTIGGEWGGKWYGGVFGWNSPDEGRRNYVFRGPPEAFGAALLLTGDPRYPAVIRGQLDNLYKAKKVVGGHVQVPHYYGDQGWYGYYDVDGRSPGLGNRRKVEEDLYLWELRPQDLARLPRTGWVGYLQGADPDWPLKALQADFDEIRVAGRRIVEDRTTMDYPVGETRWEKSNPVATTALINLTMGAPDPGGSGHGPMPLHAQLRYFDPVERRAGLPEGVAALVSRIEPQLVVVTLVNTNALAPRTVTVQAGGYGEHQATSVRIGNGPERPVGGNHFDVRLEPGAGAILSIALRRYANPPTLAFPWDR